mmetsp:Transcript_22501/g.42483  ORF Transcript_22501/g.42483 Transcript_22501/m.42483 type:complete len:323 (-) Transcript_22501:1351-2319(-)
MREEEVLRSSEDSCCFFFFFFCFFFFCARSSTVGSSISISSCLFSSSFSFSFAADALMNDPFFFFLVAAEVVSRMGLQCARCRVGSGISSLLFLSSAADLIEDPPLRLQAAAAAAASMDIGNSLSSSSVSRASDSLLSLRSLLRRLSAFFCGSLAFCDLAENDPPLGLEVTESSSESMRSESLRGMAPFLFQPLSLNSADDSESPSRSSSVSIRPVAFAAEFIAAVNGDTDPSSGPLSPPSLRLLFLGDIQSMECLIFWGDGLGWGDVHSMECLLCLTFRFNKTSDAIALNTAFLAVPLLLCVSIESSANCFSFVSSFLFPL